MNRATRRRHWPLTDEATFRQVYAPLYDNLLPERGSTIMQPRSPLDLLEGDVIPDAPREDGFFWKPETPCYLIGKLDHRSGEAVRRLRGVQ